MASGSLPHSLHIHGTSATNGGQSFAGLNLGTIKYASSDNNNLYLNEVLKSLPTAKEAPFNAYQRQHDPTCLRNTRVDLLQEIHDWVDGEDSPGIFWLSGLAGTGKSTIARTIARRYFDEQRLAASFFFSRGGGDVGHAGRFVTSITVQLAHNVPESRQYICNAVAERNDIVSLSLRDQWHHLVLSPLSKLEGPLSYVLVVDALDECDDENNIQTIVQLLADARSLERVRLRVFLTSRPEVPIRHGFGQVPHVEHQDFVLHNILPSIVNNDISLFLQHYLGILAQKHKLGVDWPGTETIAQLVRNACGLFIWAATAYRFIHDGKRFAHKRLDTILASDSTATAPEKHLNEIYVTVLKSSIYLDYTDEEREEHCENLRYILGSVVILLSPLSAGSLGRLLHTTDETVNQTLEDLHAVLEVPEDQARPLQLHHPSFRDFILNRDRCGDANFCVDEKQAHAALSDNCLRLMSSSLRQYICGIETPGASVADMGKTQVDQCLPLELQYACLYWIQHLQKSGNRLCDKDQVHQFLQAHLLHWLEALGWMQKVLEGIHAIDALESIALASDCPNLYAFIHDTKRFALYSRSAIEQAPLQVYCSALVFAPEMSVVKKQFVNRVSRWIKRLPKVEKHWNALLQTLEGHEDGVYDVAFSQDGKTLASASHDRTVKVWDASSGAVLQTLKGHRDDVRAVAFSQDGKTLASASHDGTVKLWDTGSGAVLQTLKGHKGGVWAVAFLRDGKTLASALHDGTVKLWDTSSGAVLQTLKGHKGGVSAIACSRDGKTLASASLDGTVKLWDAGSGVVMQTLKGHKGGVSDVAFSQDSKTLASASHDRTVKLWDAGSGAVLQTLKGHEDGVSAVAFSRDGKTLASASLDRTVKLWDASSGAVMQKLKGHERAVWAVAFSRDGKTLASASHDRTVKLWDASLGAVLQTLKGHKSVIWAVAFSQDSKTLASASHDRTVKIWDVSSGAVLQILHVGVIVETMSFSEDGTCLQTDQGSFSISSASLTKSTAANSLPLPPSILVQDQWVCRRTKRILWLSPEHRPRCIAVYKGIVAFGYNSGRVMIIEFAV